MDYSHEEWKPVVGYEGRYEVSNLGRVKRQNRRVLKPFIITTQYLAVTLSAENIQRTRMIHCLVAAAFIGPRPYGLQVNHKDGVKINNNLSNLEYVTRLENMRHAVDMGLMPNAETNPGNSKLTAAEVREIRVLRGKISSIEIAAKFGISPSSVTDIALGRRWKHVS